MLHDLCIGQDESKMKDLVNRLFPPTYGQQDMHIPVTQPVARSLLVIDNQTIETNATAACCSDLLSSTSPALFTVEFSARSFDGARDCSHAFRKSQRANIFTAA